MIRTEYLSLSKNGLWIMAKCEHCNNLQKSFLKEKEKVEDLECKKCHRKSK